MHSMDHIERYLRQMAEARFDAPLPTAGAIWWRAELRRRLALEERATRPMRIAEGIACAVCMAAAALMAGQFGMLQLFIR